MLWEGNDIIANLYDPPAYIYAFRRGSLIVAPRKALYVAPTLGSLYVALTRMRTISFITTTRPIVYYDPQRFRDGGRAVDNNDEFQEVDTLTRLLGRTPQMFVRHEFQDTTGHRSHVHLPLFVSDDYERSDVSDLEDESEEPARNFLHQRVLDRAHACVTGSFDVSVLEQ